MAATHRQLAIVGPTASGKTGLAIELAKKLNGEIICADSRTIYRGMDIGTAKPSNEEQDGVSHYLLDILNPDQSYSAAEFKHDSLKLIGQIKAKDKLPIVVGGTGLYVAGLLYDYEFLAGANNELRAKLEDKDIVWLQTELKDKDIEAYKSIDLQNKRRVIRAIETAGLLKKRSTKLADDWVLIGLNPPMDELEKRIKARTKQMLDSGLVDEVRQLIEQYGKELEPFQTAGYREVIEYVEGKQTFEELEKLVSLHTRQLAKRQLTWFKRNQDIVWFQDSEQALAYIDTLNW